MERAESRREGSLPHYASFMLRCWRGEGERVRVRLIEVASGESFALADLAGLPGLLQRLLASAERAEADSDSAITGVGEHQKEGPR